MSQETFLIKHIKKQKQVFYQSNKRTKKTRTQEKENTKKHHVIIYKNIIHKKKKNKIIKGEKNKMKIFNTSRNNYIFNMQDLNKKKQTHAYDDNNRKYLIYIDENEKLRCRRCLGNLTDNLSKKISDCAFLNKWGF